MIDSLEGFGARCQSSLLKIVRQYYFGEVIALRHRAGHGTSLSNAAMPVGPALTDLPLSQMEPVDSVMGLQVGLKLGKKYPCRDRFVLRKRADFRCRKKKSGSLHHASGWRARCAPTLLLRVWSSYQTSFLGFLESKPSAFLSHFLLLAFFIFVSDVRVNQVTLFWQKLARYAKRNRTL